MPLLDTPSAYRKLVANEINTLFLQADRNYIMELVYYHKELQYRRAHIIVKEMKEKNLELEIDQKLKDTGHLN